MPPPGTCLPRRLGAGRCPLRSARPTAPSSADSAFGMLAPGMRQQELLAVPVLLKRGAWFFPSLHPFHTPLHRWKSRLSFLQKINNTFCPLPFSAWDRRKLCCQCRTTPSPGFSFCCPAPHGRQRLLWEAFLSLPAQVSCSSWEPTIPTNDPFSLCLSKFLTV